MLILSATLNTNHPFDRYNEKGLTNNYATLNRFSFIHFDKEDESQFIFICKIKKNKTNTKIIKNNSKIHRDKT
jgi:hypothetical protein